MTPQKKTTPAASDGGPDNLRFEQALERLETIVDEMENGELDLETMISRFEEGRRHLKSCAAKLDEVERRIEMLVKKDDAVTLEPFDTELADDAAESPGVPRGRKPVADTEAGELPF